MGAKGISYLLKFLAQGIACPRKVIINSDKKVIEVQNAKFLANVNTQEEFEKALEDVNKI